MAIKFSVGLGVVDIGGSDTTIIEPGNLAVERISVEAFSLHNDTAGQITVTIYESPDLTSGSGQQVAEYKIAANRSADVNEVIGQGYEAGENLIAVGSGAGVNARVTVTTFTEGD